MNSFVIDRGRDNVSYFSKYAMLRREGRPLNLALPHHRKCEQRRKYMDVHGTITSRRKKYIFFASQTNKQKKKRSQKGNVLH